MQEFSPASNHNDDAENIMFINCFYSCLESRYALGMLTFHTLLKERKVNWYDEDTFRQMFRNAGAKYSNQEFTKFKQALAVFQYLKQHPLFTDKIIEQIKDAMEDYEQTMNQIFDSQCDPESGMCEIPSNEEIDQTYLQMKRQEIESAIKFLKDEMPFEVEEKLTLLGFL
jgi:uncharacterized protein YneF (UPF0154 family)